MSSCDLDNSDNNQAGENLCENDLMDILGVNTEGDVKDLLASSPENCLIEPIEVKLSDDRCLNDSYQTQSAFTNENNHVLHQNLPRQLNLLESQLQIQEVNLPVSIYIFF